MREQLNEVRHDYIRYANCWEDADVLIEGLKVQPGDRVLSIGSAGDNSFSLLVNDPELLVAVDINPIQLNLIELKKAAIIALDHESFLQFLGFRITSNRRELFQKVKEHLSVEMQQFWDTRMDDLEAGIIYQGKFERYFKLFHTKILPLIHTKKRINRLFAEKDTNQQKLFYREKWNNRRWRMLFKVFFSKFLMGRIGRDPEFLKEVKVPVSTFILSQVEKHLSSVNCQHNYFLQFILKGQFESHLPHYARQANFKLIKTRIDQLTVFNGLAEDAFKQYSDFNKFNLSNIFEYMNPELFLSVTQNLVDNGVTGARYAYWNLMVPRQMYEIVPQLEHDKEYSESLTEKDKGFFYSNVIIDVKR
jgi:S-adenosylmethionine-diacylglycerol 3-amino-3-carboxypropyl transferase